jgi:putative peptidoglycan lipid II flippase
MLLRRGHFKPDARLASRAPRILGATLLMSAFLWLALQYREPAADFLLDREWIVVVLIACSGGALYGLFSIALGAVKPSDYKAYSRTRP